MIKVINKDDDSDNDGSSSNDDNYVKDYGDNYGDSYSTHHEICDYKNDNDDDNSDNNAQTMNVQITLHIHMEGFQILAIILLHFLKFRNRMTVHEIYYKNIFPKMFQELFKSYSFLLEESDRTILAQGFGLSEKSSL